MSTFTEAALVKKLGELNATQQCIQILSLWLIHHRKHYATIVKIWLRELSRTKDNRKLYFMFLANDVIQNSKKKGPEFSKEFGTVLKKAFEHMAQTGYDERTRNGLLRILQIWGDRGVYDMKQIEEFQAAFTNSAHFMPPPRKKVKVAVTRPKDGKERKSEHKIERETVERDRDEDVRAIVSTNSPESSMEPVDPPEPEELIRILQELENSASSDAVVREKIASLPPEVSEMTYLMSLEDKKSVEKLNVQVNDALELLNKYNTRLAAELADRKKLATMLRDFMQAQQELLAQAEQRLQEYQEKLAKVHAVKKEVHNHIQNLPDLTQLPDVTGGLAPLPSAGDLFNM